MILGKRMWPQIIDSMFWPFAMKAVSKRLNILQVDILGRKMGSILHSVEVKYIPVKSYNTLFCPTYVLDARLHIAGGAGPPKWELRSRIGVYLGHLTFQARIVALVWNSTTDRVSTQYHVIFEDDFYSVPYIKAGTFPPDWENLVKYSSEMSTTKYVNLADTWLNGQSIEGDTYHISDLFAIVTDHTKRPQTNTPGSPSPRKIIHTPNSDVDN